MGKTTHEIHSANGSHDSAAPHRHSILFISFASIIVAAVSTVVAKGMELLIGLITNISFYHRFAFSFASPAGNHLGFGVVIVPVIGAVIIGYMARYGCKAIRGDGIPEAMEMILQNRSRISPNVTVLKPLSAAISIGTGGPFGAEGPIIATGAALGSVFGQIFSTTATERKTLLAAGAAAGITAIFGTPVSAVLLAVELLLFEFSPRSLVPVAFASATAAAVRVWLFGTGPIFAMTTAHVPPPAGLLGFIILGGIVGLISTGVSRAVYWVEEAFEHLPIHWMWWPAIGAVAVGIIGYFYPRTFGVGYENIQDIISNKLPLTVVAGLCIAKFVSWVISLGSGTSGGTLAPLFTIGGGFGALLGAAANHFFPGAGIDVGMAGLVGMAAMFSGASRALLGTVVFAFEATLQPEVLPAMLAGATGAYLVSHMVMKYTIMTEKIARRGVLVPYAYEPDTMHHTLVSEVMTNEPQTLPASMKVGDLAQRIGAHDPEVSRYQASLVVDEGGSLLGIVTRGDIIRAIQAGKESVTILEAGSAKLVVTYPDETLGEVLAKMNGIGRLPVVDRSNPRKILGYLGRANILAARLERQRREAEREPGWLAARKLTSGQTG